MRAPRALIPLLAVCGAAAVVVTAGAGAAIEGAPDLGPALADGAREVPAATVTAMTWNVCGDAAPGCPLGSRPADLVRDIPRQMADVRVGGRKVNMDAVFLQEVCSGHVTALRKTSQFKAWSWEFAPYRGADGSPRKCANGQGRLGVAIGSRERLTDVRATELPSPPGVRRVALCGQVGAWHAKLCTARLSTARWDDDPRGDWRRKQAQKVAEVAGTGRVVFGGDLGEQPESRHLDVLYRDYAECDQGPGTARTGAKTRQDWNGTPVEKTDYLFASAPAGISCGVPETPVRSSDHRPVGAVVRFPDRDAIIEAR
ncbi:endonuclease/exonuclease/phosphatase family protein [Actinomadura miaoliensis]|uniref:Endonuclease/exonuclease/phosphatase domain-containing protein n=1 Tax=Actinomadura miaoliensis TaxID=430685 RepID=A0ABP7V6S0_9ACTN